MPTMTTILAPSVTLAREEWPDADFDLPDGDHIRSLDVESDKEDEDDNMDWDIEMDFGKTGGAKVKAVVAGMAARSQLSRITPGNNMITIRPPLTCQEEEEEEDDEGVSTIKVAALPNVVAVAKSLPPPIDEDMESAFALPSDLTQLSLAPLSLSHRSSKNSLEWGDKDQTSSSSQSSDAYSTLGFADAPSSRNSVSSFSLHGTDESEGDEGESELEGLVIPSGLFESGQSAKHLKKMLELKKHVQITEHRVKVASPDPEDDFESGLLIEDDADFSPSRLVNAKQNQRSNRSKSAPARAVLPPRPPSRMRADRAKSPANPPTSSARQLQRLKLSSSPPPRPLGATLAQTYKEVLSAAPPTPTNTFLSPKPGSLRGQKSHSGLKPPTPPSTQRKALPRKASLSSLMGCSTSQASGSGIMTTAGPSTSKHARYDAPTAASRAKSHTSSTSRIHGLDFMVPPARPSTPSSNPAALRLTMPTSMRMKSRPALSSIFPTPATATALPAPQSSHRATSPMLTRPPSTLSLRSRATPTQSQSPPIPSTSAPRLLRRPKRQRTYGDGTELDGFDDLPTDRDKEGKFRVQPKPINRGPISNPSKASDKEKDKDTGTMRKKGRKDTTSPDALGALTPATNTLRRTGRIEFPKASGTEISVKKKKDASSPVLGHTRRKPTLIRHLGTGSGPKVVGEMKWNPTTLRWEGNDQVLRDFDTVVGTSTRPALITHLTGSSIGSPVGSFAAGARKFGNMIFDPTQMCWVSTLEEEDVFADLADDEEDEDAWESKGGTIRASQQGCTSSAASDTSASTSSGIVITAPSPARSRGRTNSESESDRGSRASIVYDVADDFVEVCRAAEERHRQEMKGWRLSRQKDPFTDLDRLGLYEIRALATRKY